MRSSPQVPIIPLETPFALLLLLYIFVLSPNLIWLAVATSDSKPTLEGLLPGLLGLCLLTFASPWIWHAALMLAILSLPSFLESWYVAQFGKPTDAAIFGLVLETDSAESLSFMGGLWIYVLVACLALVLIAVPAIRHFYRCQLRWSTRPRLIILGGSLIGLLLLNAAWLLPEPIQFQFEDVDNNNSLIRASLQEQLSAYSGSWPTGFPVRIISVLDERATLKRVRSQLEDFRFEAKLRNANTGESHEIIVLVIGESSRPDRWQVYGYPRVTTPRLAGVSNLVLFTDAVTPWAWTRMSVPIILTRKPAADMSPFFPERSFIAAYNEIGFKTIWLSNQNALSKHDSSTSLYARDADEVSYYNPAGYKDDGGYDDGLIPAMERALRSNASRKLIVLHTLGSHFNYNHRYPSDFNRFTPSQPEVGPLSLHDSSQAELSSNAYDNSILFTDHVLGEIIARLVDTGQSAALFYVADHGENLFVDHCGVSGHGQETERDFRVPMVFWYSNGFAEKHQKIINQARLNANKSVSTEAVFHSIIELVGISLPDEDLSRSIFSEHYLSRPRWVYASGGINFDTATVNEVCKLTPQARGSQRE